MSNPIDSLIRRIAERILELLPPRDSGDDDDEQPPEPDPDPEPGPEFDMLTLGEDDSVQTGDWITSYTGVAIEPTEDINGLSARISDKTTASEVILRDADGDELAAVDSPGTDRWVYLDADLNTGEEYQLLAWSDGDSFNRGRADVEEYPLGGSEHGLAVKSGHYTGQSTTESYRYAFSAIHAGEDRRVPELDAIELPEDGEGQTGHSNYCGMAIVPDQDLKGLEVRLGGTREDGAKDITALHVFDDEQDQLATQLTTGNDAGDWIGIDYDFNAGQEYRVLANGEGEDYVRYRADAECPYTGDALDVVAGSYSPGDESQSESYVYNADRIRGSLREVAEPEPEYRDIEGSQIAQSSNARLAGNPVRGEREVAEVLCQEGPPEDYDVDARIDCEEMFGFEPNIAHMRWQVMFPSDFEVHQNMDHGGIKLSGFADHRGSGGAGGNHDPGNAYSLRMYATSRGPPNDYTDGDDIPVGIQVYDISAYEADKEYGHMHPWTVGITKGEWTDLDLFMSLDTNRVLGWVNERSAFDSEDHGGYEFLSSSNSDRGIHEWRDHYYFGGPWGSPKEQSIYHRRTAGWTGDNCPEM